MIISNILPGNNVYIDPSSSVNNVKLGDNTRIAGKCNIFGSSATILEIGAGTYIGMNTIINGFEAKIVIGSFVSIAPNVFIMSDSGPNASPSLQNIFPLIRGDVHIGDHTWIGAGAIIMPGVNIGKFCVVAANSVVKESFGNYLVVGGTPAKIIRELTEEEIIKLGKENAEQ
jgi:acetyltransferase-like isoleucine patch superfamily enzyme